ncbi:DUF520 family protein, partial [Helicobacter rodentium]
KELNFNEKEKTLILLATSDNKAKAIKDILDSKLVKRNLSLKVLKEQNMESASGGNTKITYKLNDVLDDKSTKAINAAIKNEKFKVSTQILGNEIRVKAKDIDELQKVIAHLRKMELEISLSFGNFS